MPKPVRIVFVVEGESQGPTGWFRYVIVAPNGKAAKKAALVRYGQHQSHRRVAIASCKEIGDITLEVSTDNDKEGGE